MKLRSVLPFLSLIALACGSQTPAAEAPVAEASPAEAPVAEAPAESAPAKAPDAPPVPENSARPATWGYAGDEGPSHWASLSPAYSACAEGKAQSPIDISTTKVGGQSPVKFNYGKSALKIAHHEHVHDILDNGHTIQVTVEEGSTLTTAKNTYSLKQFHFHTPSENVVDGKHYPMEMHMVHQAADGSFAVVALFFSPGAANPSLAQLIENFPAKPGDDNEFPDKQIDLRLHLPKALKAQTFLGSFTTPPCTEGVEWIVMSNAASASEAQLTAFAERLNNNNRPVQELNARAVGTATATVAQ